MCLTAFGETLKVSSRTVSKEMVAAAEVDLVVVEAAMVDLLVEMWLVELAMAAAGGGLVSGGEDSSEIGATWIRIGNEPHEPNPLLTRCGHSSDLAGPAARRPWRLDGRHEPDETHRGVLRDGPCSGGSTRAVPPWMCLVLVPDHAPEADSGPDLVVVFGGSGGGGGGGDAYGDSLTILFITGLLLV